MGALNSVVGEPWGVGKNERGKTPRLGLAYLYWSLKFSSIV